MKADDKVTYEETDGKTHKEKYSNFEELRIKVEILTEAIEEIQLVLRQNNIHFREKKYANMDIYDELGERLEQE